MMLKTQEKLSLVKASLTLLVFFFPRLGLCGAAVDFCRCVRFLLGFAAAGAGRLAGGTSDVSGVRGFLARDEGCFLVD